MELILGRHSQKVRRREESKYHDIQKGGMNEYWTQGGAKEKES